MENIIRSLGRFLINIATFFYDYTKFTTNVLKVALKLKIFNPAISLVFIRQIYFTGVQILPMYSIVSLVFGVILVGGLTQGMDILGAPDQVSRIMVIIVLKELAPLVTGILLALRSSTAVIAEISLMKVHRQIDTLESLRIDPYEYLYLPRIASGLVSMVILSTFFVCITVVGGYLILSITQELSFDYMITNIYDNLDFRDMVVFLIKVFVIGYVIMSVPIFTATQVKNAITEIPVALLRGMMRLFYALIMVELLGLLAGIYL
ncbi:MlaE family ABC transporter permease [Limisalsivibrio acetivorans]|uniref:MlaE family ABC transporter permease n=1 Tax=Limisalsivibrio acetivorans TaxID=1304888 RepID=UPI0003B695D1|nr:ABC transporter permease [Limisalsivibrio acetivorans]